MRIALSYARDFTVDFKWCWVINCNISNRLGMLKAIQNALMIAVCCFYCLKMRTHAIVHIIGITKKHPPIDVPIQILL
jgi:hypothetical protein